MVAGKASRRLTEPWKMTESSIVAEISEAGAPPALSFSRGAASYTNESRNSERRVQASPAGLHVPKTH